MWLEIVTFSNIYLEAIDYHNWSLLNIIDRCGTLFKTLLTTIQNTIDQHYIIEHDWPLFETFLITSEHYWTLS